MLCVLILYFNMIMKLSGVWKLRSEPLFETLKRSPSLLCKSLPVNTFSSRDHFFIPAGLCKQKGQGMAQDFCDDLGRATAGTPLSTHLCGISVPDGTYL